MEAQREGVIEFTKMHGLGNDYVYVDAFKHPFLLDERLPHLAMMISNRNFGVGSDGLILVCPPSKESVESGPLTGRAVDFRMRMFNLDGSEGEMCGNGIRCAAKFAVDKRIIMPSSDVICIETGSGVLEVVVTRDKEGRVSSVSVDMGEPRLKMRDIPALIEGMDPDSQVVKHSINFTRWGSKGHWLRLAKA